MTAFQPYIAHSSRTMANARPKFRSADNMRAEINHLNQRLSDERASHERELSVEKGIAEHKVNQLQEVISRQTRQIAALKSFLVDDVKVSKEEIDHVLDEPKPKRKQITFAEIERRICRATKYTKEQIRGKQRQRPLVMARQAVCYWTLRRTNMTLGEVGKLIRLDHTTVLHGAAVYPKKRAKHGRKLRSITKYQDYDYGITGMRRPK